MQAVIKRVQERYAYLKLRFKGDGSARHSKIEDLAVKYPAEDLRLKEQGVEVLTHRQYWKVNIVRQL